MKISIKPDVFIKLVKLPQIFQVKESRPTKVQNNRKLEILQRAIYVSPAKYKAIQGYQYGELALVDYNTLYFFPESSVFPEEKYNLDGCDKRMHLEQNYLHLKNKGK